MKVLWNAVLIAMLLGWTEATEGLGFCRSARVLDVQPVSVNAYVLSRRRRSDCGMLPHSGLLLESVTKEMLYDVHDVREADAWIQGSDPPRWFVLESNGSAVGETSVVRDPNYNPDQMDIVTKWERDNLTDVEVMFQQKIAASLIEPVVEFAVHQDPHNLTTNLSGLLRDFILENGEDVMSTLQDVYNNSAVQLLHENGQVFQIFGQLLGELLALAREVAEEVSYLEQWSGLMLPSQNETFSLGTSFSRRRSSAGFYMRTGTIDAAPFILRTASFVIGIPLVLVFAYFVVGVSGHFLLASVLYTGVLFVFALGKGFVESGLVSNEQNGLILGRLAESFLTNFFKSESLRSILLLALEKYVGA